jgi:hypothetical protein
MPRTRATSPRRISGLPNTPRTAPESGASFPTRVGQRCPPLGPGSARSEVDGAESARPKRYGSTRHGSTRQYTAVHGTGRPALCAAARCVRHLERNARKQVVRADRYKTHATSCAAPRARYATPRTSHLAPRVQCLVCRARDLVCSTGTHCASGRVRRPGEVAQQVSFGARHAVRGAARLRQDSVARSTAAHDAVRREAGSRYVTARCGALWCAVTRCAVTRCDAMCSRCRHVL